MRQTISLVVAVCLVALGGRELRADDSAAEVQAVLRGYRAALLKSDGRRAVELVDDGTLAYYAKMREMALTAPAVQVKRLPMMDRLMVVFLRHRLPTEELRTMSREALFVYAVEEGWIGRNSVTDLGIGVVSIRGDEATGQVVKRGQPTSLVFPFTSSERNGASTCGH